MASISTQGPEEVLCFICKESLQVGVVSVVKKRGVATLLASAVKRRQVEHQRLLEGVEEITTHTACQKKYNIEKSIVAYLRRESEPPNLPKTTRSSTTSISFDFNNQCFLCDESANEEYKQRQNKLPVERRNPMVNVTVPEIASTILSYAKQREDDWGKKIGNRIGILQTMNTDLVAVKAKYHKNCINNFYKLPGRCQKRGQPTPNIDKAMEVVFKFLEENREECQFSLGQLLDEIPEDSRPHIKTVKKRLEEKYGDDIIIAQSANRGSIVCFKSIGHKLLSDNWYSNDKLLDPQEERARIVKTAGNIILQDIRSKIFRTDSYPLIDNFHASAHHVVPETLLLLLHTIILTNKQGSLEPWKRKCLALAHAIMVAVRPKSFLSSIMIGVATYCYKKFGSKLLLNLLATLGFSASYDEASRLEGSYVMEAKETVVDVSVNPFSQFIFDNADFNVNTLDGHATFHAMGGIMAVTPRNAVTIQQNVHRKNVSSSSRAIGKAGTIEVKEFRRPPNAGLKSVKIKDIYISPQHDIVPSASDIAWLYGKNVKSSTVPGWNGFMELRTEGEKYECSKIVCLPFINATPNDYSTVYTSILTAHNECKSLNQNTCVVTFDQPLFWKARDVVACVSDFSNVIVRLGGFHLLMSFMGAMGTIMAGSGLKELFCEVFASNSVDKILSGHAYARAVRGHSLVYAALGRLVIDILKLEEGEIIALDTVIDSSYTSKIDLEDPLLKSVTEKLSSLLKIIEGRGPTAALWIQYFRMCTLMKNFIRAERTGDWELHLNSVRDMIPYFHAAGHLNYAKSAHLYYQDMLMLPNKMDQEEFEKFALKGYFTIRRSDKFWCGIWSDMTIEQVLMRAMKSYGGLTRGRGISDSVLSRWIVGMICLQSINEQMEIFCGVRSETSDQHVDMRPARVSKDNIDIKKLSDWFAEHSPFPETQELMSISSGAVAPDYVNCYLARSIGITSLKTCLEKGNFEDLKLKRKDKVVTLASVSCSLKVKNKTFTVDPLTLFQRVCITKQSEADLRNLFKYELAPFPMSLFSEEGMHKGRKSKLYDAFIPIVREEVDFGTRKWNVIDGGFLLHRVVWPKSSEATFQVVCQNYVDYVQRHFGSNAIVVFDGYPVEMSYQSTKAVERYRRSLMHSSTKFVFSTKTSISTISQGKFLSNDTNKINFITMLKSEMEAKGIKVKQAVEDADVMIVETAVSAADMYDSVIITGEDIDLLVLLTALGSSKKNVYFQKSGKGNSPTVLYSAHSFKYEPQDILFLHAVSGCDTTSAPFGIGKNKVMQIYSKNPDLSEILAIFKDPEATPTQIADDGEKFLVKLYGGTIELDSLEELRYRIFSTAVAKSKCQLARLPPTRDAAKYHLFRTYLQIQAWMGSQGCHQKLPSAWGWKLTKRGVVPITTTMDAAPEQLLHIISCKCTTGCASASCSCKKTGLLCSAICKHCVGTSCENSPQPDTNENDTDDECKDSTDLPLTFGPTHEKDRSMDPNNIDDNNEGPAAPKRSKVFKA